MSATKWILLDPGDTFQKGDQVWSLEAFAWVPVICKPGMVVPDEWPYRRMDKDATAAAEYDHETKKYRKEKP